ncbi:MAG: hypothetical protein RR555_10405 [Bacteroidales bacterium]
MFIFYSLVTIDLIAKDKTHCWDGTANKQEDDIFGGVIIGK